MAGNKKPRKKYKPKPILANPLGYVVERMTTVADTEDYISSIQLKNSTALLSLTQGRATKHDIDILIAMSNIAQALRKMGAGAEYTEVSIAGREAIISIAARARKYGKFISTGPEIVALNTLMELHDAQMELVTVQQLEEAIAYASRIVDKGEALRLSTVFIDSYDSENPEAPSTS